MNRIVASLCFVCLATVLSATDMAAVVKGVQTDLDRTRNELQQQRQRFIQTRREEHRKLADLDARLVDAQAELTRVDRELPAMESEIAALQQQQGRLQDRRSQAWEVLRENRKECELVFLQAGLSADVLGDLDGLLRQESPAGEQLVEAVDLLADHYLTHYSNCNRVRRVTGAVMAPNGTQYEGEILWVGGIGVLFIDPDRVSLAAPLPGSDHLQLLPGRLNTDEAMVVRQALATAGGQFWLVLDITDGRALAQLDRNRGLFKWLQAGGPIVIPLLIVALAALIMVVERGIFLTRLDSNVDKILGEILPLVKKRAYDKALETLDHGSGPVREVLRSGLEQGRRTTENLEEILQESVLAELPALERFLGALAVLAAVSPLLGLLGTVSGMIATFEVITVYGTGDARLLSGGISEALITTEIGLIIAVPILLAHAWLNRHVRTVVGHMDRAAISLVSAIREGEQGRETESSDSRGTD